MAFIRGIFSMSNGGKPMPEEVVNSPYGVSLRTSWKEVEPVQGQYNWSFFDQEIARLAPGRQLILRVNTGGIYCPAWTLQTCPTLTFVDHSAYRSTGGEEVTIPVLWCSEYVAAREGLLRSMLAHFKPLGKTGFPNVMYSVGFGNAFNDEFSLPCQTPEDVQMCRDAGYTSDGMVDVGEYLTLLALQLAHGNHCVSVGQGVPTKNGIDPDPMYVVRNVVDRVKAVYPYRLATQYNGIHGQFPVPPGNAPAYEYLYSRKPRTGAQMVYYITGDSTYRANKYIVDPDLAAILQRSCDSALAYGTRYLEVYQKDMINPALASVISAAHQQFLAQP